MTNLQEAARRMYSAKGFTDYGKILGAGLKEATRNIAIAREQEEKEAKAERKQRDAFALDLYAKRPSINEGAVPPEMLPVIKNWLLDTRNQYNEAVQNLSGDISDPSYRAAIDMANKVKTNYANLSSQMSMFREGQKEYLETVGTTDFSNSNSQTDIDLVSSVYNKDFSNFTVDNNGKVVLETKQGIKTLDEINELFNSLNPKTPKQTQGLSKITNQGKKNGMDGYELTESDFNDISADLGMLFADRQNTISYVFDNPGAKQFISNSFKLEDGSFPDEKMDLADKKDGIIDDEWIRNPENYDLIYDKVIEHGIDLAKRSNQEGLSRYNMKQKESKNQREGENPYSNIQGEISTIINSNNLDQYLLAAEDEFHPPIWEANLGPGSGKSSGNYRLVWDSTEKEFQVQKGQGSSAGDYRWVIQDSLPFPNTNKFYKEDRQELLNFLEKEIGWIQNRQTSNIEVDEQFGAKPADVIEEIEYDPDKDTTVESDATNINITGIPSGEDARNFGKEVRKNILNIFN